MLKGILQFGFLPFPSSRMLEIWCRNSRHESKAKCIAVVSNMEALRERTTSSEDFLMFKVEELKKLFARARYSVKRWQEMKAESRIVWFMQESGGNQAEETGCFCLRPYEATGGKVTDKRREVATPWNFVYLDEQLLQYSRVLRLSWLK